MKIHKSVTCLFYLILFVITFDSPAAAMATKKRKFPFHIKGDVFEPVVVNETKAFTPNALMNSNIANLKTVFKCDHILLKHKLSQNADKFRVSSDCKQIEANYSGKKHRRTMNIDLSEIVEKPNFAIAAKLRNLTLAIEPSWVRRGQSANLHCYYDLDGAPLYSVKWYRGNLEFYRYSPFEHPPAKIFQYTGIKVDLSVSNATQVTLRNVGFNLSGNFTCEVTVEAPTFFTAMATNVLKVVELPSRPPTLWTERVKYDAGDILKANCSTPASKPAPSISFLLNTMPVGADRPTHIHPHENLYWASRELVIQLLPSHYQNGQLILRCTAEVDSLYNESTEAPLGTTRKEPIPERVTSPGGGAQTTSTSVTCIYLTFLTLAFYIRCASR